MVSHDAVVKILAGAAVIQSLEDLFPRFTHMPSKLVVVVDRKP